jgi:hypothetical protein
LQRSIAKKATLRSNATFLLLEQRCNATQLHKRKKKATATTTLPSPSSSSYGITLQHSATKKATAATLPSPSSFSFYSGRKLDFENKLSFAIVTFFFFLVA